VCKAQNIDFILPMSTQELMPLSMMEYHGDGFDKAKAIVSEPGPLATAIDKGALYDFFKGQEFIPDYVIVTDVDHLGTLVYEMFEQHNHLLFMKPCMSNGSRGLYKLVEWIELDLDNKSPSYNEIAFDGRLMMTLANSLWDRLLISEFLEGREWSVDVVRKKNGFFFGVCRVRAEVRSGICMKGFIEENTYLLGMCKHIMDSLGLEYNVNLQFIETESGFMLLEINPRVSGTIALSSQVKNFPFMGVKLAEGVQTAKTLLNAADIKDGKSGMVRVYREIFF
jgi:hypothetical protein